MGKMAMARYKQAAAEQSTTRGMPQHRRCIEDGRCMIIDDIRDIWHTPRKPYTMTQFRATKTQVIQTTCYLLKKKAM
jgi:hypoxanthine-guanine phosphoribosyltransferase